MKTIPGRTKLPLPWVWEPDRRSWVLKIYDFNLRLCPGVVLLNGHRKQWFAWLHLGGDADAFTHDGAHRFDNLFAAERRARAWATDFFLRAADGVSRSTPCLKKRRK